MSSTYLHRQKIILEGGTIKLLWATFDSNVFPQPGPSFGSRPLDFSVCGRAPANKSKEIVELFEGICREMDGGCLKNRREWISGDQAWELWRVRLKRATGIDLGRPRLSKIYWHRIPPQLFGKASPIDGIELVQEGTILEEEAIRLLINANVELPIRLKSCGRGEHRGRLGFINDGSLCAYRPRSRRRGFRLDGEVKAARTHVLGVKTYGHVIAPVEGVFAETRNDGRLVPTAKANTMFVLVNSNGCVIRTGSDTAGICTASCRYSFPFCFDASDAEDALTRVQTFMPEENWSLQRADHFVAQLP